MVSFKTILHKKGYVLAFALLACVALPSLSSAQIAPQTCDTAVWDTMTTRARLETEREIMQNQNLIFKADSVLTYTCFDKMADHASKNIGELFTTSSYWGSPIVTQAQMNTAITNAVLTSMSAYISGNFNHALLGGRLSSTPPGSPPAMLSAASGGNYSCAIMNQAWFRAKCMNFSHTSASAENDGFYPMKDIAGYNGAPNIAGYATKGDVRKYPAECTPPIAGAYWSTGVDASLNVADTYQFKSNTQNVFTKVTAMTDPESASCSEGVIRTGITVVQGPGATNTFQDVVCTIPGCHPHKGGCIKGGGTASECTGGGPC